MYKKITIEEFLRPDAAASVLLDVRSPLEYTSGHIPGAMSFPLFSDEERASVGIMYKTDGSDRAMQLGLEIIGPRMREMTERAAELTHGQPVTVHCWRGGKRSESVGWLLDFAGLNVSLLSGGYKAYRTFQRSWLSDTPLKLIVLGGKTGSGKTEILRILGERGEQVLDLEHLARHKGSAFGWIGEEEQPTTEQFENNLFEALIKFNQARHIWVENESKSIGRIFIPDALWAKMKSAPLLHLEVPMEERVRKLVRIYAEGETRNELIHSFQKISKRLGGQHVQAAIEAVQNGDYHQAARIALMYYDKTYYYGLEQSKAPVIEKIEAGQMNDYEIADMLMSRAQQLFSQVEMQV
jgi:tRNA 2-selenouridine synthase